MTMSTNSFRRRAMMMAALAIACSAFAGAQSYGTNDQVLTIGVADPPQNGTGYIDSNGYLIDISFDHDPAAFVVALRLPDGAEIRHMCAYANDLEDHTPTILSLIAVKLVPGGGGDPFVLTIPNSVVQTTMGAGYAEYCTGDISYTLRDIADLDGDGSPDNIAYFLQVQPGYHAALGGVLVTWRRQVSPPPDTPTFDDVPASDGAFAQIEALAASGITAGCGGGNFCPNTLLTRRQMAVYLAKALGLHWAE
jgi:hypothetical protein